MENKKKQKTFLGMPMNWDRKQPFKNAWNSESDQVFLPKSFGIGWSINFHAVGQKMGLLSKAKKVHPGRQRKDKA